MAELNRTEIDIIEKAIAFPKGFGYVLDFSDRTIAEYFKDEFRIDIDDRALAGGGSKRTRLTTFLQRTDAFTAAKVLRALWDRREGLVMRQGAQRDTNEEAALQRAYLKIIERIEAGAYAPSPDALDRYVRDRTLEELVADIERALRANKPEPALDHLHTYCMMKFSHLLKVRGIDCTQNEALHARFGKYIKALAREMKLTNFTLRALKMTISLMDAFNDIRNNHSLAHDNKILEPAEARFVFENVSAALRFLRSVETGRYEES